MAEPTKNQKSQSITQEQLAQMLIVAPTRRRRESFRFRPLARGLLMLSAVVILAVGAWGLLRGMGAG